MSSFPVLKKIQHREDGPEMSAFRAFVSQGLTKTFCLSHCVCLKSVVVETVMAFFFSVKFWGKKTRWKVLPHPTVNQFVIRKVVGYWNPSFFSAYFFFQTREKQEKKHTDSMFGLGSCVCFCSSEQNEVGRKNVS